MASRRYRFEEDRNALKDGQFRTRRWEIDTQGNRIGQVEILAGSAEQYQKSGTVITCVNDTAPVYTFSVVANETDYNAYLEFRPASSCDKEAIYATGYGMPAKTTVRMVPENIVKQQYCLYFQTPGNRSRLLDENNKLIATTDGNTPGKVEKHMPLERYKVVVGVEIVSFKVTNNLPVAVEVFIKSGSNIIKQTPSTGIAPGGVYTVENLDATSYMLQVVASGMKGRSKKAQILNNNNQVLATTDGSQPATTSFTPQASPYGDIRLAEEGAVVLNDLQISDKSTSQYKEGKQQVIFFITSATSGIGPFTFRVQNVFNDQILAVAAKVDYNPATGYVLDMPTPYVGEVRLRATAHRGTDVTSDDWEAIDKTITLFPNEDTYLKKFAIKYEGLDQQGRQTILLLVNTSYDGSSFKWGQRTLFEALIPSSLYPGYTHIARLFGEINGNTFDATQTFDLKPKTGKGDIASFTYSRGGDAAGTIKLLFGTGDSATNSAVTRIDARLLFKEQTGGGDPIGGGGTYVPGNTVIDASARPERLNIGREWTTKNGQPVARLTNTGTPPGLQNGHRNMWWINGKGPNAQNPSEPYYDTFPTNLYFPEDSWVNVYFGQGPRWELYDYGYINKAYQTMYIGKANT